MYVLKIACQEPDGKFYYETGLVSYKTYDKALLAAYSLALKECADLNLTGNEQDNYFEVAEFQEYPNKDGSDVSYDEIYPVSVAWFDKPCYDRENDLSYMMVSGYQPVKIDDVAGYNAKLKEAFGSEIAVEIKLQFDPDDGTPKYYVETANAEFDSEGSGKLAFDMACRYLRNMD